jgi:hypothetical protein
VVVDLISTIGIPYIYISIYANNYIDKPGVRQTIQLFVHRTQFHKLEIILVALNYIKGKDKKFSLCLSSMS